MTAPASGASALRVLLVGELAPLLTTGARFAALRELGVEVEGVDSRPFLSAGGPWARRLAHYTLCTPGVWAFNAALLEAFARFRPNVLWLEKPVFVFPRTIRRLRREPGCRFVYHNTDDWRGRDRLHAVHWRYLLRELPHYDLYVLSNAHNVREFREAGLGPVHHMELAANPAIRDPGPIPDEERRRLGAPVGFVGHHEPETERLLAHVARAGIAVKIWGQGWDAAERGGPLRDAIQGREVWGDEYARALCSFDVNVGIVSKWNRNHTASRTFQIPALGAFLLHERNELVTGYFREGVEAEFFGSAEELLEKCRHYLAHPDERLRIAAAGRRRCVESGYFEVDRVREVLPLLQELVAAAA
jgi:hypothetical protein